MTDANYNYPPIRDLADIEAIETQPIENYVFSWNLADWLERGMGRFPQKMALAYHADGDPESPAVTYTYDQFHRRVRQSANLFNTLGVGDHDVVMLMLPTVPELYVGMIGAAMRGVVSSINWMLKSDHVLELIKAGKPKVIVALGPTPGYEIWETLSEIKDQIPAGTTILTVQGPNGEKLPASDFLTRAGTQRADAYDFEHKVRPDDLAALFHSGGTTGAPKLVRLPHRALSYKMWANSLVMGHGPHDTIFGDYPMFHIAGVVARGFLAVADSMSVIIPTPMGARDKKFLANYWRFIEKYGITVFSGVPTTLAQLAKTPPKGEDISSLRPYSCTGSTAFPTEIAKTLEASIGNRVLATYGATEFCQNVTQAPRDGDPRYGSAGIRLPFTHVRIARLDEDGKVVGECGPDEIGAVLLKGPSITPGYVDPRHNKELFVDGWLNNGDLGRLDRDGFLWITGRQKDVIIRGGHNIDPLIIEETLNKHPEVLFAAAVSKPDAYAGELPMAYVQLVPNASVTAEELMEFSQQHITERAANPKEIVVIPEMPLTHVGKPSKVQLRADAASRTFTTVLTEAAGADAGVTVTMFNDPVKGSTARINIATKDAGKADLAEKAIRDTMAAYATPYVIERAEVVH